MIKSQRIAFLEIVISSVFSFTVMYIFYLQEGHKHIYIILKHSQNENRTSPVSRYYKYGTWRNLNKEQVNSLSELGRILFLEEKYPKVNTSTKNYKILNWRYGGAAYSRHIQRFTNADLDPFENCSVRNCIISHEQEDLQTADLVLIEISFLVSRQELPQRPNNSNQIWVFMMEESPLSILSKYSKISQYPNLNGLFNWAMTYRMDSDIPIPYGRTVALRKEEKRKFNFEKWDKSKKQDTLITILISQRIARNNRWRYLAILQRHINIDRFAEFGREKCLGLYTTDCKVLSRYKFYLAFENSNCNEYITEKVWWNSFQNNAIPIIMGTTPEILHRILPPGSYIHINNFINPKDLGEYIIHLNNKPNELTKYFEWRNYFKILNEHGYFGSKSKHYCRICEALNYNSEKRRVYGNVKSTWFENQCQRGWSCYAGENMIL